MATNLKKAEFDEPHINMAVNSRNNTSDMTVCHVSITSLY